MRKMSKEEQMNANGGCDHWRTTMYLYRKFNGLKWIGEWVRKYTYYWACTSCGKQWTTYYYI